MEAGIPLVDDQHRGLLDAVTNLEGMVRGKQPNADVEEALNELTQRSRTHLETESKLAFGLDLGDRRQSTRTAHSRLFEDVARMRSEFHSGERQMTATSVQFLKNWLTRHIQEDKKFAEFLKSATATVGLVNGIITGAHAMGASDIHIDAYPGKQNSRVRLGKDGALFDHMELTAEACGAVISRIKVMASMDISEKRKPQDGRIDFVKFGDANLELRVATIPTGNGLENVVMRLLSSAKLISVEHLGFDPRLLARVKDIAERPHGLFLACGPTGSGKTTTLHSILNHINTPERKIWTAEDPIEISQAGLSQVQVNPKIGWNFASAMRSLLRADPDVIMIGEMRDQETANIAIEASLTGHLVFSTLHTNSAPESVVRLLDLGMDRFNFSDAILGVLAQRLVKRLCPHCKQPHDASGPEVLALLDEYGAGHIVTRDEVLAAWRNRLGVRCGEPFRLYRPGACEKCHQTGFSGRSGLHELLVASEALRHRIRTSALVDEIRDTGISEGMRTPKQNGIEKVLEGLTTLQQVRTVCA